MQEFVGFFPLGTELLLLSGLGYAEGLGHH